jgi:hypothetical protein
MGNSGDHGKGDMSFNPDSNRDSSMSSSKSSKSNSSSGAKDVYTSSKSKSNSSAKDVYTSSKSTSSATKDPYNIPSKNGSGNFDSSAKDAYNTRSSSSSNMGSGGSGGSHWKGALSFNPGSNSGYGGGSREGGDKSKVNEYVLSCSPETSVYSGPKNSQNCLPGRQA